MSTGMLGIGVGGQRRPELKALLFFRDLYRVYIHGLKPKMVCVKPTRCFEGKKLTCRVDCHEGVLKSISLLRLKKV